MPTYVVHILNDAYAMRAVLANTSNYADFRSIDYRIAINGIDSCTLEIVPSSSKLAQLITMNRILLYRDGALQFGGTILKTSWNIGINATDDTIQVDCLGGGIYLDWRLIVPSAGSATDERTDQADDLAKAYVTHHASSTADIAARQFSDLTVQADAGACSSWTETPSYEILLDEVQKLQKLGGFDWRCVPSATGYEFQTGYPQWGLDRTFGNGVNTDAVLSLDRRNYSRVGYSKDTMGHYNYVYVGGATAVRERSTAGDVTAYKRRERWESASSYEDNTAVDYIGDMRLKEMAVTEGMEAMPLAKTWKDPWDIGDLVTIKTDRYGMTYQDDVKITAVNVRVDADGVETVEPEMIGGV
ncbi:MAG: hypothetical protein WC565_04510 [Parcubacteria group bacterium]